MCLYRYVSAYYVKYYCHQPCDAIAPVTLRASCGAVYCNRSCLWVCGCLWVCYHDNSKLRASILTKLGLQLVKVVIISSWLNFGRPAPRGRGLRRGENFWLRLTTASAQCLRLLRALFSYWIQCHTQTSDKNIPWVNEKVLCMLNFALWCYCRAVDDSLSRSRGSVCFLL